jgi:hypothetical protein
MKINGVGAKHNVGSNGTQTQKAQNQGHILNTVFKLGDLEKKMKEVGDEINNMLAQKKASSAADEQKYDLEVARLKSQYEVLEREYEAAKAEQGSEIGFKYFGEAVSDKTQKPQEQGHMINTASVLKNLKEKMKNIEDEMKNVDPNNDVDITRLKTQYDALEQEYNAVEAKQKAEIDSKNFGLSE